MTRASPSNREDKFVTMIPPALENTPRNLCVVHKTKANAPVPPRLVVMGLKTKTAYSRCPGGSLVLPVTRRLYCSIQEQPRDAVTALI